MNTSEFSTLAQVGLPQTGLFSAPALYSPVDPYKGVLEVSLPAPVGELAFSADGDT